MAKKRNGPTARQLLDERRKEAMPEVKLLCKTYGRKIISSCIMRLAAAEKADARLRRVAAEVAEIKSRA